MKKFFTLCWMIVISAYTFAGDFTPGNLVVVRVGDGSGSLTNAAHAVFLDEYTTSGTLVQSIPFPTSTGGNNRAFSLSGTATSEGALTLSVDRRYLVMAGYEAAPGLASVSSDATINRIIARIDSTGAVNTTTGYLAGSAYRTNNIRGAVTIDGTSFWTSGAGSNNSGGVWHLPFGSFIDNATQVCGTPGNTRVINIFDGQLYVTSASSVYYGLNAIGTGTPITSGETAVNLPGFPGGDNTSFSFYGFQLFDMDPNVPGVDVAYLTDDRTTAPNGGIYKYSLVGGTWVPNGNVTYATAVRGLTAHKSGNTVTLFATTENGIVRLIDNSGYNQTINGLFGQVVVTATNTRLRGIAFTPKTTEPISVNISDIEWVENFTADVRNNELFVSAQLLKKQQSAIQLYDLSGKVLVSEVFEQQNAVRLNIPLSGFSSGIYFLRLSSAEGNVVRKIWVTR